MLLRPKTVFEKIHGSARHLSRNAAVQAVYQMEQNPADRSDVVRQFLHSRFKNDVKGTIDPDLKFFTAKSERYKIILVKNLFYCLLLF